MNIKKLLAGIVLGLGVSLSGSGCVSYSSSLDALVQNFEKPEYVEYRKAGYSIGDSDYLAKSKIPPEKVKKYRALKDKFNLDIASIGIMAERKVDANFAEKCLSLGFNTWDIEVLKASNANLEKVARFKKNGALSHNAVFLAEKNIPLEYYMQRKSEVDADTIIQLSGSQLRDVRISKKKISEFRVEYKDFSKLEIEEGDGEIPRELLSVILCKPSPKIDDRENFYNLVMTTASELEYDLTRIRKLEPKEAVKLAVDITGQRINYKLVDIDHSGREDMDFIRKYGKNLSHDRYFELRYGDCDKYAAITSAIFSIFKEFNPRLKNVYLVREFGGEIMPHAWNSVVVLGNRKITVSHIDPTWADNGGRLEAGEEHVNRKKFTTLIFGECEKYAGKR